MRLLGVEFLLSGFHGMPDAAGGEGVTGSLNQKGVVHWYAVNHRN
jgi:hypothetical protein